MSDHDRVGPRFCRRRRRQPQGIRREDRRRSLEVPDGTPDRRGPDDLRDQREGVRRDHGRRHGDLVGRRHGRLPAAGLRARRQQHPIADVPASGRLQASPRSPLACSQPRTTSPRPPEPSRRRSEARSIATPAGLTIKAWDPDTSNTQDVKGHVLLGGKPVAGVKVSVHGWVAPATDSSGAFTYPVDITMPVRHEVTVASAAGATVERAAVVRLAAQRSARRRVAVSTSATGSLT